MDNSVTKYFRYPERYGRFGLTGPLSKNGGYFQFGNSTLYGRVNGQPADTPVGLLESKIGKARTEDGVVYLPFDITDVVDDLRQETYTKGSADGLMRAITAAYYFVRPILPVAIRKHLQSVRLRNWDRLPFPHWPVDRTVDSLMEQVLLMVLRAENLKEIPFIWFWPDNASSSAVVTHDIETAAGTELCPMIMDINDSFGISASFQVIPEQRYHVTKEFLDSLRQRGFEVVVHDLNHDGRLFHDRKQFLDRVAKINAYGEEFGAIGFRAGILYRNQQWFDALDFEYDMSVPNVAHLDPQRGGCCTVMPYFIGNLLELPVTMTQDYTLFNILNDYSTRLWEQQIELIMEKHGLINAIIHPDYITDPRERAIYEALLGRLADLREKKDLWITTPGEVNRWWRQRAQMTIVEQDGLLRIEGAGNERASIAYATEHDGQLVYSRVPQNASPQTNIPRIAIG